MSIEPNDLSAACDTTLSDNELSLLRLIADLERRFGPLIDPDMPTSPEPLEADSEQ